MGRCELTGKGPVVKNLVSHSNIKTKSISQPNIQKKRLFSQTLGELVVLRVATSAIRDMEHVGGLDKYLLNLKESALSKRALAVKSRIRLKMAGSKNKASAAPVDAAPKAASKDSTAPAGKSAAKAGKPAKNDSEKGLGVRDEIKNS